jgi:uroporphyrinogen-III synthase
VLVLLTRAMDEALRSAEKLAALGHHAILSPVLEMVPTGAEWPSGVVDGVLATSAKAFELLSISPDWPAPEARRLMPLHLVGERTSEAARERGFEGRALVAPDARTLAAGLAETLGGAAPSRFLYLAGRDRKPELEAALAAAGHAVETIEVYSAEAAEALDPDAAALIGSGAIGAVLHYSQRSARLFLALSRAAGLDLAGVTHVAISADAAEPLTAARLPAIRIADEPREQAMLALLPAGRSHVFVDPGQGAAP